MPKKVTKHKRPYTAIMVSLTLRHRIDMIIASKKTLFTSARKFTDYYLTQAVKKEEKNYNNKDGKKEKE